MERIPSLSGKARLSYLPQSSIKPDFADPYRSSVADTLATGPVGSRLPSTSRKEVAEEQASRRTLRLHWFTPLPHRATFETLQYLIHRVGTSSTIQLQTCHEPFSIPAQSSAPSISRLIESRSYIHPFVSPIARGSLALRKMNHLRKRA